MNNHYSIDFKSLANKYINRALEDLRAIASIPSVLDEYKPDSVAPFGIENKKALDLMFSFASRDGLNSSNVDNYAGFIDYGTSKELVGVLAHLDVVPATGEWSHDPFDPIIKDGLLFARGVADDKGPLIAAYYAIIMLRDLEIKLPKTVRLIFGCDEESGSRCIKRYQKKHSIPRMAFSPDADFPVIYGEKANYSFDIISEFNYDFIRSIKVGSRYNIVPDYAELELVNPVESTFMEYLSDNNYKGSFDGVKFVFKGTSAHAMHPSLGINAGMILLGYLAKYYNIPIADFWVNHFDTKGEKLGFACFDSEMKDLTINLALIDYSFGKLRLGFNARLPLDSCKELIKKCLKEKKELAFAQIVEISFSPRHYIDPKGTLVKTLMEAYRLETNDDTEPFTIGGGTYSRYFPNCVAFGGLFPGRMDTMHQVDEHIWIEDLERWIAIYARSLFMLGSICD